MLKDTQNLVTMLKETQDFVKNQVSPLPKNWTNKFKNENSEINDEYLDYRNKTLMEDDY